MPIYGGWGVTAWRGGQAPSAPAINIGVLTRFNPYLDPSLILFKTSGSRKLQKIIPGIKNPRITLEWYPNETSWLERFQNGETIDSLHLLLRKYQAGVQDAIGLTYNKAHAEKVAVGLIAGGFLNCSADFVAETVSESHSNCPFGGIEEEAVLPWHIFDFYLAEKEETNWHEWSYTIRNVISRLPNLSTKDTRILQNLSRDVTGHIVRDSDGVAEGDILKEWHSFPDVFKIRIVDSKTDVDLLGGVAGELGLWSTIEAPGSPSEVFLRRFRFVLKGLEAKASPPGSWDFGPFTTPGNIQLFHNLCKQYFYNDYYYQFYQSGDSVYWLYAHKADTEWTWGGVPISPNLLIAWSIFALDDKIVLAYVLPWSYPPESSLKITRTITGTIQGDGTISWGGAVTIGWSPNAYNKTVSLRGAKINGSHYWWVVAPFLAPWGPCLYHVAVSTDDGSSWIEKGYGTQSPGDQGLFSHYRTLPFYEANKILQFFAPKGITIDGFQYQTAGRYFDLDDESEAIIKIDDFIEEFYLGSAGEGTFRSSDGTIHVCFIDDGNDLLHYFTTKANPSTWTLAGTVAKDLTSYVSESSNPVSPSASPAYDPVKDRIFFFYNRDSGIYCKAWDGSSYTAEALFQEEGTLYPGQQVKKLTVFPYFLGGVNPICWLIYNASSGVHDLRYGGFRLY